MDPNFFDRTEIATALVPFETRGRSDWVVIAKAGFDISEESGPVRLPEPIPLAEADIPFDEEDPESIQYESDYIPFKPATDLLCVGQAHAPGQLPLTEMEVSFSVGGWGKRLRVVGDRHWETPLGRLAARMSKPKPFLSMPITYRHAYGGMDASDKEGIARFGPNPIGRGYTSGGKGLGNLPLPNIELPDSPIKGWKDRRAPAGFGPVGRTWDPRSRSGGTLDEKWQDELAPELPADFSETYYNGAPSNQQLKDYLKGDERIRVENMHPYVPVLETRLPSQRVRVLVGDGSGTLSEQPVNLDTLWINMEELVMTVVWRCRMTLDRITEKTSILLVSEDLAATPTPAESYALLMASASDEQGGGDKEWEEAESEMKEDVDASGMKENVEAETSPPGATS
ncbi:MAG: DUF2169 domain-containing protein [Candidatus Eisenbacteria bacterium]|uniref:DUF2169 domain-containing protein n=1 Tax=Eiseniibacteriota bacterium TaxID=2212470 RepID=A0A7Y2EBT9_UNCEI|nr:DUF2169 domain-containing protein [Candidatus Eisenbacteria bacterium]